MMEALVAPRYLYPRAGGADMIDVAVALQMVLGMEGVACRPK